MVEFNPDGSIKLPEQFARNKEKLKSQRCIKIKRELVNFSAPKRCVLHITLSDVITDDRFIETIYNEFKRRASVPSSIKKINEKQFDVTIETDFRRCSDCNSLINKYREFIEGALIEEKGGCTFEGRKKNFCYEDYFE
ncbi:MAG: hypothetical protein KKC75_02770 [Nanoarchaeota archaeon]|nr:hypothetical protein [Nanoarchaeota archaeon]MBU1004550.1 hypothetical protein [Nanoarchaeota archaeon]MBU1945721.1 hypothetical protein [Nanoarchaeota archaeon]